MPSGCLSLGSASPPSRTVTYQQADSAATLSQAAGLLRDSQKSLRISGIAQSNARDRRGDGPMARAVCINLNNSLRQTEVGEVDVSGKHGQERDAGVGRVRSMLVTGLHIKLGARVVWPPLVDEHTLENVVGLRLASVVVTCDLGARFHHQPQEDRTLTGVGVQHLQRDLVLRDGEGGLAGFDLDDFANLIKHGATP